MITIKTTIKKRGMSIHNEHASLKQTDFPKKSGEPDQQVIRNQP